MFHIFFYTYVFILRKFVLSFREILNYQDEYSKYGRDGMIFNHLSLARANRDREFNMKTIVQESVLASNGRPRKFHKRFFYIGHIFPIYLNFNVDTSGNRQTK